MVVSLNSRLESHKEEEEVGLFGFRVKDVWRLASSLFKREPYTLLPQPSTLNPTASQQRETLQGTMCTRNPLPLSLFLSAPLPHSPLSLTPTEGRGSVGVRVQGIS